LRDWDAATYDRIADPMTRWGGRVLDWLPLRGDERVLDAGCGSGRVTEQLLGRLPEGRVVALDASAAMIDQARERLAGFGDRVEYLVADLAQGIPIDGSVDAILSTATLHWILDHDAVFGGFAGVLRPGGWLAAQAGAPGNVAHVLEALAAVGEDYRGRFQFADPTETQLRLEAVGFEDVEVWVHEEPTTLPDRRALEDYLRTIFLGPQSPRPADDLPALAVAAAEQMGSLTLDYVRLNVRARRSADSMPGSRQR
jgi:trans-aconitate 2-methyltransferase